MHGVTEKDKLLARRRSIYLLPNLLTTVALFAGFFAIIAGINRHFNAAVIAIYIAMVMDTLDGRIARLTKTQSAFGAQYDSMSDMVAFALAPPLVAYVWGLQGLGRVGWAIAFVYLACTALRLARFNAQIGKVGLKYSVGLSCPPAAAVVMGLIWIVQNNELNLNYASWLVASVMLIVAILMVSNLFYYTFKEFDFKGRVPFLTLLIVVLFFILVMLDPFEVLFTVFTLYAASGPALSVWRRIKRKRINRINKK